MRYFLTVHGIVQGVGYRALVKGVALENGVTGFVHNMPDGSVTVFAVGEKAALDSFVKGIDVDTNWGPRVFEIEISTEGDPGFPEISEEFDGFRISRDYPPACHHTV